MKNKLISLGLVFSGLLATSAHAGVGIAGPAVRGASTGIVVGDFFAILVSTDGTAFSSISFTPGEPLNAAASYGSAFAIVQTGLVTNNFAAPAVVSNVTTELADGITQGDSFAILTFDTSLNNGSGALAADTFRIWTNPSWVIPADGSNFTFTTGTPNSAQFPQAAGVLPNITGTVVGSVIPEPSSYAAVAGLGILGFAASRRRRVA